MNDTPRPLFRMYILNDAGDVVAVDDAATWGLWFESHADARRVAADHIGDVWVSTVFLGLDHNFRDDGPPVLWESLIFGGPWDGTQRRYTSRRAALAGHRALVAHVRHDTDSRDD